VISVGLFNIHGMSLTGIVITISIRNIRRCVVDVLRKGTTRRFKMINNYKNHRLYNEFVQLRYDDKDFAYMWKDTGSDFFEWVFAYEIDADWGIV
jgi:hypothetical protein